MADWTGDGDVDVPFESARQNADRLGINYDILPRLPFWSRLGGQTREDYHTKVAAKIMTSAASIGRELSQTEKDVLAYHLYATPVFVSACPRVADQICIAAKYTLPFPTERHLLLL